MPSMRRNKHGKARVLRKDRTGRNPFVVGLLVIIAALVVTYFGFTKDMPFSRGFQFQAVFRSANSIRQNSPVRIAGVNIGKVVKIEGQEGTDNAIVTMEIKNDGLPIHKDARLKIRPRIFLEGNFFIDLRPGTPSAPTISDGDTIPVTQTAYPVQLDQVLTALQQDTRRDLQVTLQSLGTALTASPTPAEDANQPPVNRGKTAAESLNSAIDFGKPALKNSAIVNQALLGLAPNDLSNLVRGLAATGAKLADRQRELVGLVDNFNTTMAAVASQQSAVRAPSGCSGRRSRRPTTRSARSTPRCRTSASSRSTSSPGSSRHSRRSTRSRPGSRPRARWSPRISSAACWATCSPRPRAWRA